MEKNYLLLILFFLNVFLLLLNLQSNQGSDFLKDNKYKYDNGTDKPPTAVYFGSNFLSSKMYQYSRAEVSALYTFIVYHNSSNYHLILLEKQSMCHINMFYAGQNKNTFRIKIILSLYLLLVLCCRYSCHIKRFN